MTVRKTLLLLAMAVVPASQMFASATIALNPIDPAGVGFNDNTAAVPVGGNTGTTLGTQRMIAARAAADKWQATLTSSVTIRINFQWTALTCTATSAVLGSAGATEVFANFSGAPIGSHWYPKALANKLSGVENDPTTVDISANFNVNLGKTGCLTGTPFYLGLDGNHGNAVDLVTVLTHEYGHGLGFQTFTNGANGNYLGFTTRPPASAGLPSVWDHYIFDDTTNLYWDQMTASQRVASAINNAKLTWDGNQVKTDLLSVLTFGVPEAAVSAPASVAGVYAVGTASFGPLPSSPGVSGDLMPVIDSAAAGNGCVAFSAANTLAVNGNIALIDRGVCGFAVKAKNAQLAGARAVIIANNAAGSPPPGLGGTDPTITIPTVSVTQADGIALHAALVSRGRNKSGVVVVVRTNMLRRQGTDPNGRALLYAPNPYQSGSSVSHYDVSMFPNQLMEPAINADLTHNVVVPFDLTFSLLKDIGWN